MSSPERVIQSRDAGGAPMPERGSPVSPGVSHEQVPDDRVSGSRDVPSSDLSAAVPLHVPTKRASPVVVPGPSFDGSTARRAVTPDNAAPVVWLFSPIRLWSSRVTVPTTRRISLPLVVAELPYQSLMIVPGARRRGIPVVYNSQNVEAGRFRSMGQWKPEDPTPASVSELEGLQSPGQYRPGTDHYR